MDKKKAKELKQEAKTSLDKVRDNSTLQKMFDLIDPIRMDMDKTESFVINKIENVFRKVNKNNKKKLVLIDIEDILDWHVEKYNKEQAETIIKVFNQLKEIHDRSFWEKLIDVFKGS